MEDELDHSKANSKSCSVVWFGISIFIAGYHILIAVLLIWMSLRISHLENNNCCDDTQEPSKVKFTTDDKSEVIKREVLGPNKDDLSTLLKGLDGRDGKTGPPGPPGIRGPPGTPGKDGRNAADIDFVNHLVNTTVKKIASAEMEKLKLVARNIPTVSGSMYTRWGRTSCPKPSKLIMAGRAAGQLFSNSGGSSQLICLTEEPEFNKTAGGTRTYLSGVEYELSNSLFNTIPNSYKQNVPCALCLTEGRALQVMFPAKAHCPDSSWTKEYLGFLMTEGSGSSGRTQYICVDMEAEMVPGMVLDQDGARLYPVSVTCSGTGNFGYCPPYDNTKELTCVVCSK